MHPVVVSDEVGLTWQGGVCTLVVRRAVVEPAAVGAPRGEAVEPVVLVRQLCHLVARDVIENEVAQFVLHLHFLYVSCVERLKRSVRAVGNERLRGMPRRVNAGADEAVCTEVS